MPSFEWVRGRVRQVLAGGLALLLVIVGAVALKNALRPGAPPPPAEPTAPAAPRKIEIETPPLPLPSPHLGRADLIAAARAAAAAFAAGDPAPAGNAELVGRSFLLRIPFGCRGPGPDPAEPAASWRYDDRTGTLRLRALPQTWTQTAWVKPLTADTPVDAIEGFWLTRPWSNAERCVSTPPPEGMEPSSQTLGLAQLFAPGGSRALLRRGRPYEHVMKTDPPPADGAGPSLRLVLGGRIAGFADGQPARCRSDSPDRRPVCLIAVDLDYVAFEDAAAGEPLAEWRN